MNHKVLLADDSLTIQKVIKITLANQPYDIVEAASEDELFRQLSAVRPKIVFLDFNLSEKYTGYELTSKIKSLLPSAKVLLLLGTFDSVDDESLAKCGASDKIVKPFDSNKFIAICKQLSHSFDTETIPYPEQKQEKKSAPAIEESPEDRWKVNQPVMQAPSAEAPKKAATVQNSLHKEISDWGMSVPGVLSAAGSEDEMDLPPVIGEVKSLSEHREHKISHSGQSSSPAARDDIKFPDANDLDYPTIEETFAAQAEEKTVPKRETTSKLISIETFNEKPLEIEIQGSYVPEETDITSLEAQIMDEVQEDLWKVDEFEDMKREIESKVEEAKNSFKPTLNDFDESLFKPIDDPASIDWDQEDSELKAEVNHHHFQAENHSSSLKSASQEDMLAIRAEMEEMVKKYIRQYMDEMFKKSSEKVAWEIIPDLAENLIRQELTKISKKIISDG